MANKVREPSYKRRRNAIRELLFDTRDGLSDKKTEARLELVEIWRKDSWAYVTGRDVPLDYCDCAAGDLHAKVHAWYCAKNGRPIYWTVDERDDAMPTKPFPRHKDYLYHIGKELWTYRISLLDKVRQMYITTFCASQLDWYGTFVDEREMFVSRMKEESAVKLINDKIRTPHSRKPKWLRELFPMTEEPAKVITYAFTNSTITGVSQNFATSDARGPTASVILVDEAAFQEFFRAIYTAVLPMATRLWAVSTANIGNPGAAFFKELIFEGRPAHLGGRDDSAEEVE